ncbi:arginine vasopressin, isoform CRA_b, partial [Rattus norvegicus]
MSVSPAALAAKGAASGRASAARTSWAASWAPPRRCAARRRTTCPRPASLARSLAEAEAAALPRASAAAMRAAWPSPSVERVFSASPALGSRATPRSWTGQPGSCCLGWYSWLGHKSPWILPSPGSTEPSPPTPPPYSMENKLLKNA